MKERNCSTFTSFQDGCVEKGIPYVQTHQSMQSYRHPHEQYDQLWKCKQIWSEDHFKVEPREKMEKELEKIEDDIFRKSFIPFVQFQNGPRAKWLSSFKVGCVGQGAFFKLYIDGFCMHVMPFPLKSPENWRNIARFLAFNFFFVQFGFQFDFIQHSIHYENWPDWVELFSRIQIFSVTVTEWLILC